MIKIIEWILSKKEFNLSKKENCLWKTTTKNEELKLYRELLNLIDKYKYKTKEITTIRHYRYKTIKIDNIEDLEMEFNERNRRGYGR